MDKVADMIRKFNFRIAHYLNVRTGKLLHAYGQKEQELKNKEWEKLFRDQSSFVYELDEKVKMKLQKNSVLDRWIYEDGFEKDETTFLKRVLKNGDIFIDAGSNVGYFSLQASSIVGKDGKIVCFEPSPVTYQRLMENIGVNGFKNIIAVNKGLSDKEGKLNLNISENGFDAWNTFAAVKDEKFQSFVAVEMSTLDKELEDLDKNKISLIKIDVEGWEKFVLLGGKNLFRNYSPAIMIEFTEANTYAAGYFVQENYDILADWGYQWFKFENGELIAEERKLHYPYDNLIATKDVAQLRARLLLPKQ
jgi:FkbM family methyltransferase